MDTFDLFWVTPQESPHDVWKKKKQKYASPLKTAVLCMVNQQLGDEVCSTKVKKKKKGKLRCKKLILSGYVADAARVSLHILCKVTDVQC